MITRIIFLSFFIAVTTVNVFAQTDPYKKDWEQVDAHIKKGLPRSAMEVVQKIHARARAAGAEPQVIKSLVYIAQLQEGTRESSLARSFQEIERSSGSLSPASKAIVAGIRAEWLWQYYQRNRWKFYNRTETIQYIKDSIETWSAADFHKQISALFQQSLQPKERLQAIPVAQYAALVDAGTKRYLRPTIYDLLAFRAIDYFSSGEADLRRPAYAFVISDTAAFAPAATFAKHPFHTKDTAALQYKALQVYQQLLSFHLRDAKPDALIDADLHRLQFVFNHSVSPGKEMLYIRALQQVIKSYPRNPEALQAAYQLAALYDDRASQYTPHGDTATRYDRVMARDIIRKALQDTLGIAVDKFPVVAEMRNLLLHIEGSDFNITPEIVNMPGQPFRALVIYRNITGMHFRLLREHALEEAPRPGEDRFWQTIVKKRALRAWHQPLPVTNDLQPHSVEIPFEALNPGTYTLLASQDQQFSLQKGLYAVKIYVSKLGLVYQDSNFYVMDRYTGKPLPGVRVQPYKEIYEHREVTLRKAGDPFSTNANGHFVWKRASAGYYDVRFALYHEKDTLFPEQNIQVHYYGEQHAAKERTQIFFFTDRSMYRPGQTVHFKGIGFRMQGDEVPQLRTGFKTKVILKNASSVSIDTVEVTANEYGSFAGRFTLPASGLTGHFTIHDATTTSAAHFRVEEYKRPKFYVELPPLKEAYKFGDTVRVKGFAKAYAGNVVDGANVFYRVRRETHHPWWRSMRGPVGNTQEIASGNVTTDDDGSFQIVFPALPDPSIDPKANALFQFVVSVDVTDINGETRSETVRVPVAYKPVVLDVNIPERIPAGVPALRVRTTNTAGQPLQAQLTITATKLLPENRLIRRRLWNRPDMFLLSKAAYVQLFPHDEYDNETDARNWQKDRVVYTATDTTRTVQDTLAHPMTLAPGYYELTVSVRDKDSIIIRDTRYIEVYDPVTGKGGFPQYLALEHPGNSIEPGGKDVVRLSTDADSVYMVEQVTKRKLHQFRYHFLHRNTQTFIYPVTEADRGGFGVSYLFIKHNRVYQRNEKIDVPWTNKELDISFATFRDKTLPGASEYWKVKISGMKGSAVAAEMLASGYDASLDQFSPHQWQKPAPYYQYYPYQAWLGDHFGTAYMQAHFPQHDTYFPVQAFEYDRFFWTDRAFGRDFLEGRVAGLQEVVVRGMGVKRKVEVAAAPAGNAPVRIRGTATESAMDMSTADTSEVRDISDPNKVNEYIVTQRNRLNTIQSDPLQVRKNFAETAFFYPQLHTDPGGNIEFTFTTPEALTRWKLQMLAHTKEGAFGYGMKELVTQKDLMVQPNAPRFLRQGDRFEFTAKIANLTGKEMTGQAQLELIDAATGQSVDGWFQNIFPNQYFTVAAGGSEVVKFPIEVPYLFTSALTWRITARSGNFSDGEESVLPVLSSRQLVTESQPLYMKGNGSKSFTFASLKAAANSSSLQHQSLVIEYTSNPVWYVVQALPFLAEYPYECAEQTWNRYYSQAIAMHLFKKLPRLATILKTWETKDSSAFLSALQTNPELKSAIMEETPWVLNAGSEAAQKKALLQLFDLHKLQENASATLAKLNGMMTSAGAFSWFKGGREDRYITQYIVAGIGHLGKLGAIAPADRQTISNIQRRALGWMDIELIKDHKLLLKQKTTQPQTGYIQLHALYARSFFGRPASGELFNAWNYFLQAAKNTWVKKDLHAQAMTALVLHRAGEKTAPNNILASLRETSVRSEEKGMYWIANDYGKSFYWYHAPIETQALVIESFAEIAADLSTINALKTWLLRQKQTQHWRTTKATAEACYAILLRGTDWLEASPEVQFRLGNTTMRRAADSVQAGTGYLKQAVPQTLIKPEMGDITVTVAGAATEQPSWGAVYWQYFEGLDKIQASGKALRADKKLFREVMSDRGPQLQPLIAGQPLKVGDKIVVQLLVRAEQTMDYVHLKDLRASSLEPVNVLSGYRYASGIGYYQQTRDASMNFFFDRLPKGTHVFEYRLFVTHAGTFTGGIATIQCMYAPEFVGNSSSETIRVE